MLHGTIVLLFQYATLIILITAPVLAVCECLPHGHDFSVETAQLEQFVNFVTHPRIIIK
jgi:hypothetical protein